MRPSYSSSFSSSLTPYWARNSFRLQTSAQHQSVEEEEEEESPEEIRKEKLKKLLDISVILVMILCFGLLFSIFAPFFPTEAQKKGMSAPLVGVLFGIYELVVFLLSPIWGN